MRGRESEIEITSEEYGTYRPAIARLEDMTFKYFWLRYADYLPSPDFIRGHVKNSWDGDGGEEVESAPTPRGLDDEAWTFFMEQRWPAIHERLVAENALTTAKEPPATSDDASHTPLVSVLQLVAAAMNEHPHNIAHAIEIYVQRDTVECPSLRNLAESSRMGDVLSMLEADLKYLSHAPKSCERYASAIRRAVFSMAYNYFETFEWDDEFLRVKNYKLRTKSMAHSVFSADISEEDVYFWFIRDY